MVPNQTLQERVQQRKEKAKPPQTTTKEYRFKHTNNKKNNTCETCDPTNLEWSNIQVFNNTHHNGRRRGHREGERERVHLLAYIFVTAPVFQLDTSELNADAPRNTARREKGATKKRKSKPTTQTTTKRSRFKHTNTK